MAPLVKIVCPGFGRTGTTSLADALGRLGWRTREVEGHWNLVRLEAGRLRFNPDLGQLMQFDAFLDSPVPLVYRQLIDVFPTGVAVIVTTRSIDEWLSSMQRLQAMQLAAYQVQKECPRVIAMKELFEVYNYQIHGAPRFDRALYAESYDRHYAEVRSFVRAHQWPALEIDVTRESGWARLSEFLGVPAPSIPFPRRNVSTSA